MANAGNPAPGPTGCSSPVPASSPYVGVRVLEQGSPTMGFRQLVRSTPRSVPVSTPSSKEGAGAEGSLADQSEDLERRIVAATTRAVLGELSAWRTSVEREVACLRGRLAQVEERTGSVSENLRKLASISPFAAPEAMEGKDAPTRQLATDASTNTVAEVAGEDSQIISQEAMVLETRPGLCDEEEQDARPAPTLSNNTDLNVSNIRATLQRVRRNLSRSPGGSSLQSSPLSSPRATSSLALVAAAAAGAKEEPCEQSGGGGAAIELMSPTAMKPLPKEMPHRMSLQSQSSSRVLLVPSSSAGEFRFNSARSSCDSSPPQKLLREGNAGVPSAPPPSAESPLATNGMCSPTGSKPLLGASSPIQIIGCSPQLKPCAAARSPISAVGVGVGVGVGKPCVARSMPVVLPLQPGVGAPAQAAHRQ